MRKKYSVEEKNLQTSIPICQQSSNETSETGWMPNRTSPDDNLTNNPFYLLTTIDHEDDNSHPNDANAHHTHSNGNNSELNDNIHPSGDKSEQKGFLIKL